MKYPVSASSVCSSIIGHDGWIEEELVAGVVRGWSGMEMALSDSTISSSFAFCKGRITKQTEHLRGFL